MADDSGEKTEEASQKKIDDARKRGQVWKSRDLTGVEFLQLNVETISMMHPAAWLAPRSLLDIAGPWNESLSLNDDGEYFAR